MGSVVYETGYVVLWHFGKLLLENTFEPGENDDTVWGIIIVDNPELYLASPFFNDCGLELNISNDFTPPSYLAFDNTFSGNGMTFSGRSPESTKPSSLILGRFLEPRPSCSSAVAFRLLFMPSITVLYRSTGQAKAQEGANYIINALLGLAA